MDDFADTTSMQNPIFKIMAQQAQILGSSITEEEIQNHKNKLKNLITKLINTHNIDEETSINNDIKNETEFLSSLFKIKKNEINQNNNNNMQMQQQMMQQQMMQQLAQQQIMAEQMQNILNQPTNNEISIVFRQSLSNNSLDKIGPVMVYCSPYEGVSSIIEKYRMKSNDFDPDKKFIFNAKNLSPYLSVAEAGITNNANIFVVKP